MSPVSLPHLFALAHGTDCAGPHRCTFCGAPASEPHELSSSFTTRDTLRAPGSGHVCRGCLLCLEEAGEAAYHTGERYQFTKAFRRMCSWVVTADRAVAATKGHLDYLRRICLNPPEPPYGISIAVSGQKHILYRGVVNHDKGLVALTLEGERIDYRAADLAARLALCGRLCAATGKPALAEPPRPTFWFRVCGRYLTGEADCELWERVRDEPLTRLAVFLCPKKEDCEHEYPGDRHDGVPPAGGGADRPDAQAERRGRNRLDQGGGEATLFDAV